MPQLVIVILGKGLNPGETGDPLGGFDGRIRIEAARHLYERQEGAHFFVSGGKRIGDPESLSTMTARALQEHGVPVECIHEDDRSLNTYEQLRTVQERYVSEETKILVVSAGYHLPRVRTMIGHLPGLELLRKKGADVAYAAAEDVLMQNAPKIWQDRLRVFLDSEEMNIIKSREEEGIREIQAGTYNLKRHH